MVFPVISVPTSGYLRASSVPSVQTSGPLRVTQYTHADLRVSQGILCIISADLRVSQGFLRATQVFLRVFRESPGFFITVVYVAALIVLYFCRGGVEFVYSSVFRFH